MAAESIAMLPYTISSSIPLDHHRLLPRVLSVSSSHSAALSRNCSSSSSAAAQSSPLLSLRKCLAPLKALVTADTTRTANTTPLGVDDRVGVLLLNLGGPETLDDVQPFLFNLFADLKPHRRSAGNLTGDQPETSPEVGRRLFQDENGC
ncbi:hypothetical protein ACLB2K_022044 [Fragaria x ananassa]